MRPPQAVPRPPSSQFHPLQNNAPCAHLGHERDGGVRHRLLQPDCLLAHDDLVVTSGDDRGGALEAAV
jgi:hypothetical protein